MTKARLPFLLVISLPVALLCSSAAAGSFDTPAGRSTERYVIDSSGATAYRGSPDCTAMPPDPWCAPPARVADTGTVSPPVLAAYPHPAGRNSGRFQTLDDAGVFTPPREVDHPAQTGPAAGGSEPAGGLAKEDKLLLLNLGGAAAIMTYGIVQWDYFQTPAKATPEGWFGRTTKEGGADKLGHLWSSYAASHLFAYLYQGWGYGEDDAYLYGSLSSFGLQSLMEIGDAYSGDYGFSYEDFLMNAVGAGVGYVLGRSPSLRRKIDLRVEYLPREPDDLTGDIFTSYDSQRYLVVLKLDGFEALRRTGLSFLEINAGYFAKGYEDYVPGGIDERRRGIFVGVGLNVTKLLRKVVDTRVFDYIQVPYTGVRKDFDLD